MNRKKVQSGNYKKKQRKEKIQTREREELFLNYSLAVLLDVPLDH